MMDILIILLALLVISLYGICVLLKDMTDLNKRIVELEKKIDNIQYQTDDVLCDINIKSLAGDQIHRGIIQWQDDSLQNCSWGFESLFPCFIKRCLEISIFFSYKNLLL